MIHPDRILAGIKDRGATLLTGVPCSFLTPLIDRAISNPAVRYVGATSEGEAAGIALGTWLAGGSPVVVCQNSGLGNLVNPLTSLAFPCRAPLLLVCTWRGQPGLHDEPQHELMGRATHSLLETIDVECARCPTDESELDGALDVACNSLARRSLPFCLVVEKGTFVDVGLHEEVRKRPPRGMLLELPSRGRARRADALARVLEVVDDDVLIVATTGKTGRELFTLADRPQHFYQVGAMGCASAVAHGIALSTARPVVVLDGDGAALMKLGNLATIGVEAPPNLVHIVLDNGVHDSTGGQRTAASAISFPEIAIACGYRRAVSCEALGDLERALRTALVDPGPQFVHVRIAPGSIGRLGRPTMHPADVARRFRDEVVAGGGRGSTPVGASAWARAGAIA
jgi:phosphonopyruvate decarboxylase